MELTKEILVKLLEKEEVHVIFPNFQGTADAAVEKECWQVNGKKQSHHPG